MLRSCAYVSFTTVPSRPGGKSAKDAVTPQAFVDISLYGTYDCNLKLIAEYNTDTYQDEIDVGAISDNSPINYGIEWKSPAGFDVNLNRQQGNVGISFSTTLDTKNLTPMREIEPFYSSYDHELINNLSKTLNFNSWYDRLLYDFEKSGLG